MAITLTDRTLLFIETDRENSTSNKITYEIYKEKDMCEKQTYNIFYFIKVRKTIHPPDKYFVEMKKDKFVGTETLKLELK